jgi:hypothetical protein
MASKRNLTRSQRRAADRTAIPGRRPTDNQLAQAQVGLLNRGNTLPGTRGRQAVDRVQYLARTSPLRRRGGESVAEAAGHFRPEVQAQAETEAYFDRSGDPFAIVEAPTKGERRRLGRYAALRAQLAAGQITPAHFRRRIESWAPVRRERLLADPQRVLQVMDQRRAAGFVPFIYVSGRAAA